MKRTLSFLLAFVMMFGTLAMAMMVVPASAASPLIMVDNYDVSASGTTGYSDANIKTSIPTDAIPFSELGLNAPTQGASYVIKTAEELLLFSQNVNESKNTFRGVWVYLGADINMSGKTMKPIGNTSSAFNSALSAPFFGGVFDGQGHMIQNLQMTSSSDLNVALFGGIGGAAIMNLVIDSSCSFTYNGTNSAARVASVAAFAHSVHQDGDLEGSYSLGRTTSGASVPWLIENVKNLATVNAGVGIAGGIVGCVSAQTNHTPCVNHCTSRGTITGTTTAGLVGKTSGRPLLLLNSEVYVAVGTSLTSPYCTVGGTATNCVTNAEQDLSGVPNINTLKSGSSFDTTAYTNGTTWKITDAAGMQLVSKISNTTSGNYNFFGKTLYLANDIDMRSVTDWEPIGNNTSFGLSDIDIPESSTRMFKGTFNGNGFSIQNLTMVSKAGTNANVALFGVIRGAHILNVTIDGSCTFLYLGNSASARAAGLVAVGLTIADDNYLGTWSDTGNPITYKIENIINNATVIANAGYAGGIIGATSGWTDYLPSVKNCVNNGNISGSISAAGIIGGLVCRNVNVANCVNNGRITADNVHGIGFNINGGVQGTSNVSSNSTLQSFSYIGYSDEAQSYPTDLGYSKRRIQKVDLSAIPEITALTTGTNTAAGAYKISNADSLVALSTYVNGGKDMKGITVYLAADIDMSGKTFYPIGSTANSFFCTDLNTVPYFGGIFDGQGYRIKNLTLNISKNNRNCALVGLFGMTRGATVRNTYIDKSCTFAYSGTAYGGSYVGGLVAAVGANTDGACTVVDNCYSAATISCTKGNAAGLVCYIVSNGETDVCKVKNCTNNGQVSAALMSAGIVATSTGASFALSNCRNFGAITNTSTTISTTAAAAGIFANPACDMLSSIEGCVNEGKITAPSNLSGIVGLDSRVSCAVSHCTNYGTLTVTMDGGAKGPIYGSHMTGTFGHFQNNTDSTDSIDQPGRRVDYIGSQCMDNGTSYHVRFLSAIDTLDPDAIGYELKAYYANGTKELKLSDYGQIETTTVFQSVLATVNGQSIVEYAEDYDGTYLMALTVKNIPDSIGDVVFSITPYLKLSGTTVYMETLEITYNAGAFVSKKTQAEIWDRENGYKPYSEIEQESKHQSPSTSSNSFFESFGSKSNKNWTATGTSDTPPVSYRDGMMYIFGDGYTTYTTNDEGEQVASGWVANTVGANMNIGSPSENFVFETRVRVEYFGVTTGIIYTFNRYRIYMTLYESKVILNSGTSTDTVSSDGLPVNGEMVYTDIGYDWHTYRIEVNNKTAKLYIDGEYMASFVPEPVSTNNTQIRFFTNPINVTHNAEFYVDYVSLQSLSNSLNISSPSAGQTYGSSTTSVTVNCSGAGSGTKYYLNGSYAGTSSSSITFTGLKPGAYSVRAEYGSQVSAERVFYISETNTGTQGTTASTASQLQSSYILKYNASGYGSVSAGDGAYLLDLYHTTSKFRYLANDGSHTVTTAGTGDYMVVVDSGIATIYYNGKLLVSYKMPYQEGCATTVTSSFDISVSANNGTYYKTDLNGTDSFSTSLNSITYAYAVEFEYEKGNRANIVLRDGAYQINLLFEEDGTIKALVAPQFQAYLDEIGKATDGKNLYRVHVSSGLAQLFVNNIWVASWRMPTTITSRGVSVTGQGVDLFRIVQTEDIYFLNIASGDAEWKEYFSDNDASQTRPDISGLNNLKVYSKNTILEATVTVGSSTSGGFYLDARFFGGSEHYNKAPTGVYAGYDFSSKSYKWGTSMSSLSTVKSATLAAGTHTFKLVVEDMTLKFYCDGTLITTQTVPTTLDGWGNAGYIQQASGVTLTNFSYQGDGNPLKDTSSYLYWFESGKEGSLSHTIGMAEFGGSVYILGEGGDVLKSDDGGYSFTQIDTTDFGNWTNPNTGGQSNVFSFNTIVLQSGNILSLKRNHNSARGGYQYLAYISKDDGKSFEGPYAVSPDRNPYRFTMNGKVMQASNGRIFFVSGETEDENIGQLWIYYSDDEGVTWQRAESEFNQKTTGTNLQEGMVVELANGVMRLYARNDQGFLSYSDSYDNGVTWEMDMKNSNFPSVVSAFNVTKDYENNAIYLAWEYNNTNDFSVIQFPRSRIGLAVSYDDGINWYYVGDFDERNDPEYNTFGHWNIGVWVTSDSVFVTAGKNIKVKGEDTDKWNNYTVRISKDSIQPLARFTDLHILGNDPRKDIAAKQLHTNSVLAISRETKEVYASGDTYRVNSMNDMLTMISVQMIASFLNGTVTVSGSTATVKLGNASYVFTAGSTSVNAAGSTKTMKYAAISEDGTVKITLEDLCSILGLTAIRSEQGAIVVLASGDYTKPERILSMIGIW